MDGAAELARLREDMRRLADLFGAASHVIGMLAERHDSEALMMAVKRLDEAADKVLRQ